MKTMEFVLDAQEVKDAVLSYIEGEFFSKVAPWGSSDTIYLEAVERSSSIVSDKTAFATSYDRTRVEVHELRVKIVFEPEVNDSDEKKTIESGESDEYPYKR